MADFFFEESDEEIEKPKKEETSNRISFVNIPFENAVVALMEHPASLTLYKYVSVDVLSGAISINGYELSKASDKKSVEVFSSEKTGLIEIKTESSDNLWKKKVSIGILERRLSAYFGSEKLSKKIIGNFQNATVAVLIKRLPLPCNVGFAEYYYPQVFEFNLEQKKEKLDHLYLNSGKMCKVIKFGYKEEELAAKLLDLVRNARLSDNANPRIIVCGPRNTGKSTLLRFLVNKMISQFSCVYYLDTDPGQPEFTPPGVVSLTKVQTPLLGPPFFHLNKDAIMMFTGSISPSYIDLYNKCVLQLMEIYSSKHSDDPLFVNTMGWMESTGLQCLINTIHIVKPAVLVEIVSEDETSMFDYRDHLPANSQYFQICCKQRHIPNLSAKEMRELTLLSHLGKAIPSYMGFLTINEIEPYRTSFNQIPIFVYPEKSVMPHRLIEAINGSIVALCHVSDKDILVSDNPELPKTLESEAENQCLAYGLVKAVDESKQFIYVVAPLKKDEWAEVNAIMKGDIIVPDVLILQQAIYGIPLPFTDALQEVSTDDEEEIMEYSMLSLKCISETESESPVSNVNVFPSVEKYRKPIPSRYRKKFFKK